jgi:putative transposase
MRYIELNPVRANMMHVPADYPWSSYRANAQGEIDSRITPHPIYTHLGKTLDERLDAYQHLFQTQIHTDELTSIRNAWQTGTPLGNNAFKRTIESKLNCKVGQDRRGRPQRAPTP